ncbi:nudix hydrolase domain protein [Faustovirus]|nr:nudix hydrolase domain protein [Faustovirus]QJX73730.1 nudix hydrolase domain protein [Faustovirus]
MLPNDIIEFVILGYNPEAFLSTSRRLNGVARGAIERLLGHQWDKFMLQMIRADTAATAIIGTWTNAVFRQLLYLYNTSHTLTLTAVIYQYDAVNCLRDLFATKYDIFAYSFETIFTQRSFKCLSEILKYYNGRFAMTAQIHALRYDDPEMLAVIVDSGRVKMTSGKLYCALMENRTRCYRYLLGRITPNIEIYEYLVSQDMPQLLDETLNHAASWDFINTNLNSREFHKFVGTSTNLPTLRVLMRYGFNPALHNGEAIHAASATNMGVAIALSRYMCTKSRE